MKRDVFDQTANRNETYFPFPKQKNASTCQYPIIPLRFAPYYYRYYYS